MKVRDFLFWLHGNFEISGTPGLDRSQLTIIRRHLAKVKVYHDSLESIEFVSYLSKLVDRALRELTPAEKLSQEKCQELSERLDALFVPDVEIPRVDLSSFAWVPPPKSWGQRLADKLHNFFNSRPHYDSWSDQPLC
jgi:hypothetical protein